MQEKNFIKPIKDQLRRARNSVRSAYKWKRMDFSSIPSIYGNAMPKSGSHLLLQVLEGIMQIAPLRHLEQAPVRMITAEGRKRRPQEILRDLSRLRAGMVEWGYLSSDPLFLDFFRDHPQIAVLFLYRDPRDQLVSSVFYAVDIHKEHALHDYYASIPFDDRITTAIQGHDVPGLEYLPNIRKQYERNLNWLDQSEIVCLKFEDMIHNPQPQIERILDLLVRKNLPITVDRDTAVEIILEAIQPEKSPTYRKGTSGGWRNHFTDEHKKLFKDITGDLLIRLGYEKDNDW